MTEPVVETTGYIIYPLRGWEMKPGDRRFHRGMGGATGRGENIKIQHGAGNHRRCAYVMPGHKSCRILPGSADEAPAAAAFSLAAIAATIVLVIRVGGRCIGAV